MQIFHSNRLERMLLALLFAAAIGCSESSDTPVSEGEETPDLVGNDSAMTMPTGDMGGSTTDAMIMPETDASVETIVDAAVPADPIASSNAADALTNALCGYSERCDLIALLELVINEPCADFVKAQFEDGTLSVLGDTFSVDFDDQGMGDCVQAIEVSSCDADLFAMLSSCESAFQGQLSEGETCQSAVECSGDQICRFDDMCPGTCGPRFSLGEACDAFNVCETELLCFENECASPTPNGGNCGDDFPACASGSFCKVEATFAGTRSRCERLNTQTVGMNATCDLNGGPFCESGLSCVAQPGFLTVEFKCRPPVTPGQTCFAGAPDQCPAGYFCDGFNLDVDVTNLDDLDVEGDCIELPNAGDACATSLVGEICNVGLVCTNGVCESRVRLGESCTADAMCYSGACRNDVCAVPRSPLCE